MVPLISSACYPQDVVPFSTLFSQSCSGTLGTVWGLKHFSQGSCGLCKSTPLRVFTNSTSFRRVYLFVTMYKVGEGNGKPLQYACLENPMDGGAW